MFLKCKNFAGNKFCGSALKKTRASGRNVGKVFNPVVKLVLENQPFLMPEPAEKPSLHAEEPFVCTEELFALKYFFPLQQGFPQRGVPGRSAPL